MLRHTLHYTLRGGDIIATLLPREPGVKIALLTQRYVVDADKEVYHTLRCRRDVVDVMAIVARYSSVDAARWLRYAPNDVMKAMSDDDCRDEGEEERDVAPRMAIARTVMPMLISLRQTFAASPHHIRAQTARGGAQEEAMSGGKISSDELSSRCARARGDELMLMRIRR